MEEQFRWKSSKRIFPCLRNFRRKEIFSRFQFRNSKLVKAIVTNKKQENNNKGQGRKGARRLALADDKCKTNNYCKKK